ncbi:MAG: type I DNA topoisomerase [Candidatus Limnocylindria bacterium]
MPRKSSSGQGDLVIVESPAKARTIERYLGPEFRVVASYGHVRDLPKRKLGVDVEHDFEPEYVPMADRRKELDKLADAARSARQVWLATDLDREGEAIAWHIADYSGLPADHFRRVTFSEITRSAVQDAFAHPRDLNMSLVDAQQARRVLDRLVGYPLSRLVSSKVRRGLSAGRVQSVAVRLVVEREREIDAFTSQEYWTIAARLTRLAGAEQRSGAGVFEAQLARINGRKAEIGSESEARHHEAELRTAAYRVAKVSRAERRRNAPPPFTTSTLQQEASRKLGFGARRTMRIAQRLYEGVQLQDGQAGLITYMRTDSLAMASGAVGEARAVIGQRWGSDFVPKRPNVYRSRIKGAQEAHEAIRPTSFERTPESLRNVLKPEELRLYDLIYKRALASQMAPAVFDVVSVDVEAGRYGLRATASRRVFDGYQAVYVEGRDDEEEAEPSVLPDLAEDEPLRLEDLVSAQHFTQPPPRYTEATLIKALEERGIGRPSTYAPIIETIQQRGYVSIKDRRLTPEEAAYRVNDLLVEHFPEVVDYEFTARMEQQLDEVASGERPWRPIVRDFYTPFARQIDEGRAGIPKQIEVTDIICPQSGQPMVKRFGRSGWFLGCSGYPDCKFTMPLPGEEPEAELDGAGEVCPQCGEGHLIGRRGRFGPFLACDRYPECRYVKRDSAQADSFGTCPQCGQGTVVTKRSRRGRTFWGCDRYPACDWATWTRPVTATDGLSPAGIAATSGAGGPDGARGR